MFRKRSGNWNQFLTQSRLSAGRSNTPGVTALEQQVSVLPLPVDLRLEARDAFVDEREVRRCDPAGLEPVLGGQVQPSVQSHPDGVADEPVPGPVVQARLHERREGIGHHGRRGPGDEGVHHAFDAAVKLRICAEYGAAFAGGDVLAAAEREEGDVDSSPVCRPLYVLRRPSAQSSITGMPSAVALMASMSAGLAEHVDGHDRRQVGSFLLKILADRFQSSVWSR